MKNLRNIKIRTKLFVAFLILVLLIGGIGYVSINGAKKIINKNIHVNEKIQFVAEAGDLTINYQRIRINVLKIIFDKNKENVDKYVAKIEEYINNMNPILDKRETSTDENIKESYSKIYELLLQYRQIRLEIMADLEAGVDRDVAFEKFNTIGFEVSNGINTLIFDVYEEEVKEANKLSSEAMEIADDLMRFITIMIVISIILAILLAYFIINSISKPINNLVKVSNKIAKGDMSDNIKPQGNDEITNLEKSFSDMIYSINEKTQAIKELASGNTDINVEEKSDKDSLAIGINLMINTINEIKITILDLIEDVRDGDFSKRGDATKFDGAWMEIIDNINDLIEAFAKPLNFSSDYIIKLSKGMDVDEIKEEYSGDFNIIMNSLSDIARALSKLKLEIKDLVDNAIEGKLDYRGDDTGLEGGFKEMINGINATLDAIVMPVKEAASVLEEVSQGNLNTKVKGEYKGDHAIIKNALNQTIENVNAYIKDISHVLREISNSNLDIEVNREYKGDFVEIKKSLNLIIESFNTVLSELLLASDEVSAGSNQIASSSQNLSQSSTEQASAIEEITASIEEVAEQTKRNASNANKANELSDGVSKKALEGDKSMNEMLSAMKDISESSTNISKIIKVIDEIAFQTNILALNAAVEAARAGQHGKGFAVVAEEVRNLAARSANAAKETTLLIESSIEKAETGTNIAQGTAKSLNEIVEGINKTTNLVSEISDFSNNQAVGIEQINDAINQVSQVVQNNTAISQESASASEQLSSQADLLKEMVEKFKLKR
ncbi:MAG: methyl-accepting chemotaxis protein [Peptostreptococcaceae bacterium]|jgi:methyl-accepting chemotaxis protein|nr:methyl-accepting chemotaxis protein [Peptostreptococcaceae bacterium]